MVVFCVDISGSMSAAVANSSNSRLECVKLAVQAQIQTLKQRSPSTRVAVVVFGSSVSVIVDNGRTLPVESTIQTSYEALITKGHTLAASCVDEVGTSGDMFVRKVFAHTPTSTASAQRCEQMFAWFVSTITRSIYMASGTCR